MKTMRLIDFTGYLLLVSLVMLIAGCNSQPDVGENFKSIIRRYDQQLSVSFMTYDLKQLKESITESHFNRLDHRLTGLKKANRRMESTVKDIEFLEFKNDGTPKSGFPRAIVKTKEIWDIRHIDARTGQSIKVVKDLVYDLLYEFEQHDGVWKIEAVNVLKEKNQD